MRAAQNHDTMTRYAKLVGRKPQFSKSSIQEERDRQHESHRESPDNVQQTQPEQNEVVLDSSRIDDNSRVASFSPVTHKSAAKASDAMQATSSNALLKKAKLMRLKMKKAKTDAKKKEWQHKLRELEQKAQIPTEKQSGQKRGADSAGDKSTLKSHGHSYKEQQADMSSKAGSNQKEQTNTPRSSASEGITNPWKAMEAERRAKAEARSTIRREKRISEREASLRCYACRQVGHSAKDCPEAAAAASKAVEEQTQGVVSSEAAASHPLVCCYRCGSTEHSLAKCRRPAPRVGSELPFAHCFICQERGHLASKCPQNKGRGIYPMGGSCMLCQSVEHLAKDCPINEAQRTGGSTAASNVVIGWADAHKDVRQGADEDDFHAVSRKRNQEDTRGGKRSHPQRFGEATLSKRTKVVSF